MSRKETILIAGGSMVEREILEETLGEEFHVLQSSGYSEAVELCSRENPLLILADIDRGIEQSAELFSRLKKNRVTADTPLIALTASSMPDDKLLIYRSGADDCIIKPYTSEEIRIKLSLFNTRTPQCMNGYTLDTKEGIMNLSSPWKSLLGISPSRKSADVETLRMMMDEKERDFHLKHHEKALRDRFSSMEYTLEVSGEFINVFESARSFSDDGVLYCSMGDITHLCRRIEGLKGENSFYEGILEELPMLVSARDETGRYRYVNKAFMEFTGKKTEELYGRYPEEAWSREISLIHMRADRELLEKKEPLEYEAGYPYKDGSSRTVFCHKALVPYNKGRSAMINSVFDLTNFRTAEKLNTDIKAMAASSRGISKTLDSIILPAAFISSQGHILHSNMLMEAAFRKGSVIRGSEIANLFDGNEKKKVQQILDLEKTGYAMTSISSGSRRSAHFTFISDKDNVFEGFIVSFSEEERAR
ncbi:PAS domain S-box protein [Limisalsivibrio acetivorans]|uniref:PAS domain S-box protein n=1 Tax=Limisalsivibrio acetivorans TaxID=1304888 RepID=UPI0003B791BF|nr:PAS domain S-box protein [Limisalsivibrio acetivorans]